MSVSLLVVNYRASSLALGAIRSARAGTSLPLQVIVVDNSVDPDEAERLRGACDILLASERNDGYSGAINRGRRACDGDVIIVSNPDVIFAAGAIDALARTGAAVAGPALFWDDAHEWILPPSDLHTFRDALDHAVATRSATWRRRRDRRRVRARIAFWSLRNATRVDAIGGAVMAIRADAFDAVHGFDERFPLYFEENDFLRRVRGDIVYVPAARCRHLYNQSANAGASGEVAAKYAQSESEYLRKWSGALAETIVKAVERREWTAAAEEAEISIADPARVVIEASPLPSFETAAGHFPRSPRIDVPAEVWDAYRGKTLYLRAVRRDSGEVLATVRRTKMSS